MIGTILRNVRKISKLTQTQVGKKLNVAENTISNYETEHSSPNFDTINKFMNTCNFEIKIVDKRNNKEYTLKELSKEMDF